MTASGRLGVRPIEDVIRASLVALALIALGVSAAGCEGLGDPDGGPNAPCTRSSHCAGGLVCIEGVCGERDGGRAADASGADASAEPDPPAPGD